MLGAVVLQKKSQLLVFTVFTSTAQELEGKNPSEQLGFVGDNGLFH